MLCRLSILIFRRRRSALLFILVLAGFGGLSSDCCRGQSPEVAEFLNALKDLGPKGKNHDRLTKVVPDPASCNAGDVAVLLNQMNRENPLAANWLRMTAQAVSQVHPPQSSTLRQMVLDTKADDLARLAAFDLLQKQVPGEAEGLAPGFRTDACLPLRRISIEHQLAEWEGAENAPTVAMLEALLTDARDIDQVDRILQLLGKAGKEISRNDYLGFVLDWKIIGPFDNTDGKGFAKAFPVEDQLTSPDFSNTWPGKEGDVQWKSITSEDRKGFVDVNQLLAKHNGACVYLATNIKVAQPETVQLGMGTYNAIKTWCNGKQVMEFEVYHTNEMVDQYTATVDLKPGDNWIVIKLCQNEQRESWAQNWRFLFRVTDLTGKKWEPQP